MTVILEEMDPSQLGETFKDKYKSTQRNNGSIDESDEMSFGVHKDHQINLPLDFQKIYEILNSNNIDYDSHRSQFEDFGSPDQERGADVTQDGGPYRIAKVASDKTDATLRQTPSLEKMIKKNNRVDIEPLNDRSKQNLVDVIDEFDQRMQELKATDGMKSLQGD